MPADSMMAANNTETSARSLPAALYYVTSIAGSCGRAVLAPFLGQSGPDRDLGCLAAFGGTRHRSARAQSRL